jgi:hypothetical protein
MDELPWPWGLDKMQFDVKSTPVKIVEGLLIYLKVFK